MEIRAFPIALGLVVMAGVVLATSSRHTQPAAVWADVMTGSAPGRAFATTAPTVAADGACRIDVPNLLCACATRTTRRRSGTRSEGWLGWEQRCAVVQRIVTSMPSVLPEQMPPP